MIAGFAKALAVCLLSLLYTFWVIVGLIVIGVGVWTTVGKDSFLNIMAAIEFTDSNIYKFGIWILEWWTWRDTGYNNLVHDDTRIILDSLKDHVENGHFGYIFITVGLLIFLSAFLVIMVLLVHPVYVYFSFMAYLTSSYSSFK